jgi:hypothetical protein
LTPKGRLEKQTSVSYAAAIAMSSNTCAVLELPAVAASLRALFRDAGWLDAHTLVGSDRPNGAPQTVMR